MLSWLGLGRLFAPVTGHTEPPLTIDHEGWLVGENVRRFPSVRHYKDPISPVGILWHATSVKPGTALWKRIEKYDRKKDRAASWHCLIETDGIIYQSIPFTLGAWHCRDTPEWASLYRAGSTLPHVPPNRSLVGIELAATEECERPGYEWPRPQREAALELRDTIAGEYSMYARLTDLAHSQLDPSRRGDPGPDWMRILEAP